MAKRKKKKIQPVTPLEPEVTEGQYYWCVNCGHHGDYGFFRKKNVKCEMCGYDEISLWTLEDLNDENLDSIWPERFKTKKQSVPKDHLGMRETAKDTKKLLENLDNKYGKQTIAEKLAEIRGIK